MTEVKPRQSQSWKKVPQTGIKPSASLTCHTSYCYTTYLALWMSVLKALSVASFRTGNENSTDVQTNDFVFISALLI